MSDINISDRDENQEKSIIGAIAAPYLKDKSK